MKRMMIGLAMLLAASPLQAAKSWPEFRDIRAGETFSPRPDRAYLLMRVKKSARMGWQAPMWLRAPRAEEVAAYDAAKRTAFDKQRGKLGEKAGTYEAFAFQDGKLNNFYAFNMGKAFVDGEETRTVLIEAEPSTYVLVGAAWNGILFTCFCLGTVRFEAKAGQVTDLGTFLADKAADPSSEPELATVTNLGRTAGMDYYMVSGGVRPAQSGGSVPSSVAALKTVSADYRAAGPFVLQPAIVSNFLAPLAGVLEYRRGEVFDVKAGRVLLPH